jgi:streptomycin 6-kinase
VLKLVRAHRESEHEADALHAWDGDGAVRLLAQNGDALLLERCEPGTPLSAAGQDAALDVLIELLPRLWRPAGEPFRTLVDEAAWWFPKLPRTRLGAAAREAIEALAGTQGEQVLLHQDLHGGNVLRAERSPWLAIDPKPLVGEREFDPASLIRDTRERIDERLVQRRLDLLSELLGLDRERMRCWAIVHALAWGVEGDQADAEMINCARWLSRM